MPPANAPGHKTSVDWSQVFSQGHSDAEKLRHVVSLLRHFRLSYKTLLLFLFTSDDLVVTQRAGHFFSHTSADDYGPALLVQAWLDGFPARREAFERYVVDPLARRILARESTAGIKDPRLKVRVARTAEEELTGRLTETHPLYIPRVLRSLMPYTFRWLEFATFLPNKYRNELARQREISGLSSGHVPSSSLDDSDDDEDFEESSGDTTVDYEGSDLLGPLPTALSLEGFLRDPRMVVTAAVSSMLYCRNQGTNALPILIGVVFNASGASARVMNVTSRLAITVSGRTLDRLRAVFTANALAAARLFVRSKYCLFVLLDNFNVFIRKFQQRITNQNQQLNATHVILTAAHASVPEDGFDLAARLENRGLRHSATLTDFVITAEDDRNMINEFEALVALFVTSYAPGASQWPNWSLTKKKAASLVPIVSRAPVAKTESFPLGAFDINEGSFAGIIDVADAIRERLELSETEWSQYIRWFCGDWLTSRNIRGARHERGDDITTYTRMEYMQEVSMPFHYALNASSMIIEEHLGNAALDLGSLSRHKDLLRRRWDVNKPNYAPAKALIRHSLIARLLDCVMVVNDMETWDELANWRPDFEEVLSTAKAIVARFATVKAAYAAQKAGDDILAHSIYTIIDSLRFCTAESSVSYGDSGRFLRVLKFWARDFRGAGLTNYARECVEVYLLYTFELTSAMREVFSASLFVNLFGQDGRFIASDLYVEMLNFWLKRVFIPRGTGKTIDNIMLKGSACIESIRRLTREVSLFIGNSEIRRRSNRGDFSDDIRTLVEEMRREHVHILTVAPHRFLEEYRKRSYKFSVKAPKGARVDVTEVYRGLQERGNAHLASGWFRETVVATTFDGQEHRPLEPHKTQRSVASEDDLDISADGISFEEEHSMPGQGGFGGASEYDVIRDNSDSWHLGKGR